MYKFIKPAVGLLFRKVSFLAYFKFTNSYYVTLSSKQVYQYVLRHPIFKTSLPICITSPFLQTKSKFMTGITEPTCDCILNASLLHLNNIPTACYQNPDCPFNKKRVMPKQITNHSYGNNLLVNITSRRQ